MTITLTKVGEPLLTNIGDPEEPQVIVLLGQYQLKDMMSVAQSIITTDAAVAQTAADRAAVTLLTSTFVDVVEGANGDSAYDIAVANGFVGNESEWLASLDGADSTVEGPQGDTGPQGIQGIQGPAGADGVSNVAGPEGPIGPQGIQGSIGATGADGLQGVKGDAGADGQDGADGVSNVAGPQGPEGPQGPQGPAGANSTVAGPQGPAGPAGADGILGGEGADGATGPQGPQGPQGVKGDTGDVGADSTVAGPKGDTGDTGPQGIQGIQGIQGDAGADGSDGSQGIQGIQGIQGEAGSDGSNGTNGTDGADGADASVSQSVAPTIADVAGSMASYQRMTVSNDASIGDYGYYVIRVLDALGDYVDTPETVVNYTPFDRQTELPAQELLTDWHVDGAFEVTNVGSADSAPSSVIVQYTYDSSNTGGVDFTGYRYVFITDMDLNPAAAGATNKICIAEIEFFDDVLFGGTKHAISCAASYTFSATYAATKADDGNYSTMWWGIGMNVTTQMPTAWFRCDLPLAKPDVKSIRLTFYDTYTSWNANVYVSNSPTLDGSEVLVSSFNSDLSIQYDPVIANASYVRL